MAFYESIAHKYDNIFPLNINQLNFVAQHAGSPDPSSVILDLGCGTGSLVTALSQRGYKCVGIDNNDEMLRIAKHKQGFEKEGSSFKNLGMLEIDSGLNIHFHIITCLGNTLVHLETREEVGLLLRQCKNKLSPGGKLIVQIINYNRIFDQKIDQLPLLENENIRFERRYEVKNTFIKFSTELMIKKTGKVIINTVDLLPLLFSDITQLFMDAGLTQTQFYGNFKREPYSRNSYAMIIVAS